MNVSLKPPAVGSRGYREWGSFSAGSWMFWGEMLAGVELAVYKLHSLCCPGWALD